MKRSVWFGLSAVFFFCSAISFLADNQRSSPTIQNQPTPVMTSPPQPIPVAPQSINSAPETPPPPVVANPPAQRLSLSFPAGSLQSLQGFHESWGLSSNAGSELQSNIESAAASEPPYFRIQVSGDTGSYLMYQSKTEFVGNIDYTIELKHNGYGTTIVGLSSSDTNSWLVEADLDNDKNVLFFCAGTRPCPYYYDATSILVKWVSVQFKVKSSTVECNVDGKFQTTVPNLIGQKPYRLAFAVYGSKTAPNYTFFREVKVGEQSE